MHDFGDGPICCTVMHRGGISAPVGIEKLDGIALHPVGADIAGVSATTVISARTSAGI